MQVDKIYLINLEHRKDRLKECVDIFEREGLTGWERLDAVGFFKPDQRIDAHKEDFERYNDPRLGSERHIKGSFGCILSHYYVIKDAKEKGYKSILILEDDFEFVEGWRANIQKCADDLLKYVWNMFYLSINNTPAPPKVVTENVSQPVMGLTTSAYIIKEEMYDPILDGVLKFGRQIDVFYAQVIQKRSDVYCPNRLIVKQRKSFSDIEGKVVDYSHIH